MNLQRFILDLHDQAHNLEALIEKSKKMENRFVSCLAENREKVAIERGTFYDDFKAALAKFNGAFEDPYFGKVSIHHEEIAKVLTQFKAKINNNRNLLTLKQLGIL